MNAMDTEAEGYTCFWRIENFILFKKNSDVILLSPVFRASCLVSYFCLNIEQNDQEYLGIYLAKVPKPSEFHGFSKKRVLIKYSISLLTKSGWIETVDKTASFETGKISRVADRLVSWNTLEKKNWEYIPSGCLTVKFHISNENTTKSSEQCLIVSRMLNEKELEHLPIESFSYLKPSDFLQFPSSYKFKNDDKISRETQTNAKCDNILNKEEDILRLFQDDNLCFVTLKTSGKEFFVNKSLLCAASPVFKAMIEKDVQRKVKNDMNIDDIDNETMTSLIHLLHLELLEDMNWEKAVKLYHAVKEYQIEVLRKSCISLLTTVLSDQNIYEAFILADMHQEDELKRSALNYFIQNSKQILRSIEWKKFILNHTLLVADILHNSVGDL